MIRKASKQDLSTIAKIRIDNWRTTYKGLLPQSFLDDLDYAKEAANWLKFIQTDNCLLYVAIDDNGEILGFIGNKILVTEDSKMGEIYALHTDEKHRGKGVGKALIHFSIKLFKAENINQMYLWVVVGNTNAIEIYEHLGATIYTERVEVINEVDVPEIGMKWFDIEDFFK
ncbi:MAG: N-acetyltransferase family protein [Saprospiraceae bacterium]